MFDEKDIIPYLHITVDVDYLKDCYVYRYELKHPDLKTRYGVYIYCTGDIARNKIDREQWEIYAKSSALEKLLVRIKEAA